MLVNEDTLNEDVADKMYKKHVVITSRVHPGESQASFMVEGLINFLLSSHPEAEEARSKFVFKIIPMLNPDGVILGNYRASLLGVDLNRRWKRPSRFLHPEVYYAKQIVKYFDAKSKQPECDSGGVVFYCDFHGHSKKMDAFMYSCIDLTDNPQSHFNNMVIRTVPASIDRFIPIFNIRECKFATEREKENTARIVLFKELGLLSSHTLECTFFGSENLRHMKHSLSMFHAKETVAEINDTYGFVQGKPNIQLTLRHLSLIGEDLIKGLNFASKKRPLLNYWFRQPPKVMVEIANPFERERDEVDLTLLELEKGWLPVGKVHGDKYADMFSDQFNRQRREEEARLREETIDSTAAKRKMDAARKDAASKQLESARKIKAAQLRQERLERRRRNQSTLAQHSETDGSKSPRKQLLRCTTRNELAEQKDKTSPGDETMMSNEPS